jgi:NADH/F420H2 dehydrogenase subunit C
VAKRRIRLGVMAVTKTEKNILITYLSQTIPGESITATSNTISPVIEISSTELRNTVLFLKQNQQLRFDCLLDIWAVDFLGKNRFEVNYLLLSIINQSRVIIRTRVDEYTGLPSISDLFKSSGWLEREVWDMYGILFFGNMDLRRILTDYGFEGHPLRKDFPLSGFSEVRYDDGDKRIVYEPLEVSQEYRSFFFKNPWTYNHE